MKKTCSLQIKEEKLKSTKYELLFKYKTEINKFNEILIQLKEKQKKVEEKWNNLNEYYSCSDDNVSDFDELSEEQQINETTEYDEKMKSLNLRISNIYSEIKKREEKIEDIFENGISEDLIACNY